MEVGDETPFDLITPEEAEVEAPAADDAAVTRSSGPCHDEEHGLEAHVTDEGEASDEAIEDADEEPVMTGSSGGWTIPLLCIGISLIACCLLIPAADENRRLVYEREKLKADIEQIHKQIEVNDEFLKRVADDPTLSERLAQRQMKMVRQGTSILELHGQAKTRDMSPFELVTLPPPPPMPPYQPVGGVLSSICRNPRTQLYAMGSGMILIAAGLVLGATPKRNSV